MKRLLLSAAVLLALASLIPVQARQPGPPKTYTCSWNHDGAQTDAYLVVVDSVVVVTVSNDASACAGSGAARLCTSPLTMTTNVNHTVLVKATNAFGEASSDPFSASPPGSRPAGVVIR
jgi:hypothetical protein